MNKKIAATTSLTTVLILTMCSSMAVGKPSNASVKASSITIETQGPLANFMLSGEQAITLMQHQVLVYNEKQEQKRLKKKELNKNSSDLLVAITNTEQYVDKTWYVFSGSTPQGWDCSGLVRWTYDHMGFELEHSATAQMHSGKTVYAPKFGDIVGFAYHGEKVYYHVGVYISEDTMLHSGGKKGDKTELRSISKFAGNYSRIGYTRLVETNPK